MHVRKIIRDRAFSGSAMWLSDSPSELMCVPSDFLFSDSWRQNSLSAASIFYISLFSNVFPCPDSANELSLLAWHMKILNPLVSFHQWRTTPAFSSHCPTISVHNSCVSDGEMRSLQLRRDPFLLAGTETPVAISVLGNFSLWVSRGMV